jgi:hypothetical protein
VCADVTLDGLDTSCNEDQDCVPVFVGTACGGECLCDANAAINRSAARAYGEKLSGVLTNGTCPCHANYAGCVQHVCVSGQPPSR